MAKVRILIVDDEPGMLEVCADTLQALPDVVVQTEQHSDRAAHLLRTEDFDLLLADVRMPGIDGVELLRLARQRDPGIPVLMITAFPEVETAVASMKLGAADYVTKPFLPEELLVTVGRLLEDRRLREQNRLLQRQVEQPHRFGAMIGKSPGMRAVFDAIARIAATDTDVLIVGETGTGKELVARAIHDCGKDEGGRMKDEAADAVVPSSFLLPPSSLRVNPRSGRFVPVDCGAIPESLLESELFGHERGAFTGAVTRSPGLLEFADKGTFFLDEIDELPPRLQAKLLRVLQERKVRRVGATEERSVDLRIIAATGRDLDREMRERRFRADLYYRINVARIELPPLRQRPEDIPLLIGHFLQRYAAEMNKGDVGIDPLAGEMLQTYPWPGNIRELQNVIKRTLALAPGPTITPEDLPDEIVGDTIRRPGATPEGFFGLRDQRIAAFEREYLEQLLRTFQGDVPSAAREAKLPRGTLYRLLKKYALNPGQFRS